jgi:hypothetical protein
MKLVLRIFRLYKPVLVFIIKLIIWYVTLSFVLLFFIFGRVKWFLSKMKSYRIAVSDFWDNLEKKYFLKSGFCPVCFNRVGLEQSRSLNIEECLEKGLEYGKVGSYRRKSLIASHYIDKEPVYRNAKVEYSVSWHKDNYSCQFCSKDFEIVYSVTSRSYDDLFRS